MHGLLSSPPFSKDSGLLISQTKRELRRLNLRARKGLGQHFLVDDRVLKRLISAVSLTPGDTVIEVGPGMGILTRELAKGADRVITMNLHSPQIQGFFRVPVDHLLAGRILCDYFQRCSLKDCVVVAPDAGSAKRAGHYAIKLGLPLAILDKRRSDDTESPVIHNVIGDIKGKKALIFDDEIASGGSILEVVKALENLGVEEIEACCVHAVLSGSAVEKLAKSSIKKLVTTDTVFIPEYKKFPQLVVLSVAELFAKAIMSTNRGESISVLYDKF